MGVGVLAAEADATAVYRIVARDAAGAVAGDIEGVPAAVDTAAVIHGCPVCIDRRAVLEVEGHLARAAYEGVGVEGDAATAVGLG